LVTECLAQFCSVDDAQHLSQLLPEYLTNGGG
jgi:hypothetical protein